MNILFLDQFNELAGAQRCLLDLIPAILARGWHPRVALPGTGPLSANLQALGVPVESIELGPYRSGSKTLSDAIRFIRDTTHLAQTIDGADLLFVNGPRLLPAVALARPACPVLFYCHSRLDAGPSRMLARWALRRIRAVTIASCRFVTGWLPFPVAQVIYPGVSDSQQPRSTLSLFRQIGVIGRLAPEKGQLEFVRAVRLLHARRPEWRFLVCGAPLFADPSYARQVRSEAVGLPVEFRGWQDDLSDVWRDLDALAVPSSTHDAAPRVILEAFAAGVPVVAFPSGGIPELVEHGRTGRLATPPTPETLATSLLETLDGDATPLSANARAEWRRRFTVERYRAEVCAAIENFVQLPAAHTLSA